MLCLTEYCQERCRRLAHLKAAAQRSAVHLMAAAQRSVVHPQAVVLRWDVALLQASVLHLAAGLRHPA